MCDEQGIPTVITWSYGGKEVAVEGSWNNWKMRIPWQRSGKDYTTMKVLPSGVYQYRFIVDGQWRYIPDLPWSRDDTGNAYNILDLQVSQVGLHCPTIFTSVASMKSFVKIGIYLLDFINLHSYFHLIPIETEVYSPNLKVYITLILLTCSHLSFLFLGK